MPALTAAEREFLAYDWRWAETKDASVKTRHPGAREAEYPSAFVTLAGASAALTIIAAATTANRRLIVGTCDGILPVGFKGRPSTVRLFTGRFGGNIAVGRLMMVERADKDWGRKITTLYLAG